MLSISSHRWKNGLLQFKISWYTNEHTWETFPDMKEYHPQATSNYMVCHNGTRKKSRDPDTDLKWANHTFRDTCRTIQKTLKLYDFILYTNNRLFRVKHKIRGSKKNKRVDYKAIFRYWCWAGGHKVVLFHGFGSRQSYRYWLLWIQDIRHQATQFLVLGDQVTLCVRNQAWPQTEVKDSVRRTSHWCTNRFTDLLLLAKTY